MNTIKEAGILSYRENKIINIILKLTSTAILCSCANFFNRYPAEIINACPVLIDQSGQLLN